MNEKKSMINTGFRIIFLILLQAALYRKEKIEVFFTAVAITAIVFWVVPHLCTMLVCIIFKIKNSYGGTLQYDDEDPTDCRFRMIFNFDPEDLIKHEFFEVEVQKTNLKKPPIQETKNRDRNTW